MKRLLITLCVFCYCIGIIAQTTDEEKYDLADTYYEAKKYDKVIPILKELAEKNNAKALNFLGVCYEHGKGLPKDIQNAIKYYERSAALGWRVAQRNLGLCYEFGKGTDKNLDAAEEWYKKSIENGDTLAMVRLGWLYLDEEFHELHSEDENFWDYCHKQAEKWFRQAARTGDAYCIYQLGRYYYSICGLDGSGSGDPVEHSYLHFEKAAKMNNGGAQIFMGWYELYKIWCNDNHFDTEKTTANISTAMDWFKQSGKNDNNNGWHWFNLKADQWQAVCKFLMDNAQYKLEWGNADCEIWPLAYSDESYIYIGVKVKNKFGFVQISKGGKMLAHTPFIYEADPYNSYYNKETKLFHVYLKNSEEEYGREITIDITGKEVQQ